MRKLDKTVPFSIQPTESSLFPTHRLRQIDHIGTALREKDNGDLNIATAEDPIEYDLGGDIQQFPVIRAKGQTFSQLPEPSSGRTLM